MQPSIQYQKKTLHNRNIFYNQAINHEINIKYDFKHWMSTISSYFSFTTYSFILNSINKSKILNYYTKYEHQCAQIANNRQNMMALFSMISGKPLSPNQMPYLILRVHRKNLIYTALKELEKYIKYSYNEYDDDEEEDDDLMDIDEKEQQQDNDDDDEQQQNEDDDKVTTTTTTTSSSGESKSNTSSSNVQEEKKSKKKKVQKNPKKKKR